MTDFLALDLPRGGFCLVPPSVSMSWREGMSWRLLLLVPSFWTPISPVQGETGKDPCLIWLFSAAWESVCCWKRLMKAKQTWTGCSPICGLCVRTLRSAQLDMATCNLSLNGPYSGVSGRWRSVPRGPQEAVSVSWHGGGTADPGLVLVWLVQTPVSMTGCNVSCCDGVLGSCLCGIRTLAPFHPPGSWMMSDDFCELKNGCQLTAWPVVKFSHVPAVKELWSRWKGTPSWDGCASIHIASLWFCRQTAFFPALVQLLLLLFYAWLDVYCSFRMNATSLFLVFLPKCSWRPEALSQCACEALEEEKSRARDTAAAESPGSRRQDRSCSIYWNYQGRTTVLLLKWGAGKLYYFYLHRVTRGLIWSVF